MRLSSVVPPVRELRSLASMAAIVAVSGILAACNTAGGGGLRGLFGGPPSPEPQTTATQVDPTYFEKTAVCPKVEIRSGTESLRFYERGGEDDPARIRYQASIGDTARDCRNAPPDGVLVRVGVSGRVIAGPKGGPGNLTIPLRIAVLKDGSDVVYSKLHQIAVSLTAPTFGAGFSLVDDQVTFAVDPAATYRVFVGFDERK